VSVLRACRLHGISRQGFYKRSVAHKLNAALEARLLDEVKELRREQPFMGGRKLFRETSANSHMGRDAFFGLLRRHRLLIKRKARFAITTTAGLIHYPNLYREAALTGAAQVLVSDITYIKTDDGFAYAALVTDAFSRKILGYDLSTSLEAEGALRALRMALGEIDDARGVIHHSDRGCQYSSSAYVAQLEAAGMRISMTERHHCAENALAERVNGILKHEFMLHATFRSARQAKRALASAIYIYNHKRPHLSLGYAKPAQVHAASMTGTINPKLSTFSRT